MKHAWWVVAPFLVGCTLLLDHDFRVGDVDAGDRADGGDAGPDGGLGCDVFGASMLTHYALGETTTAAEDLTIYQLAIYVPDGAEPSGFRVIPGETSVSGTVCFRDVPPGPYYLYSLLSGGSAPVFYYSDDRVLDLGFATAGQPGLPDVTLPSLIRPNLTGLSRTWSADYFTVESLDTGTEHYPITFQGAPPLGDVSTLSVPFDWTTGYGWALPQMRTKLMQDAGLEILHLRDEPVEGSPLAPFEMVSTLLQVARMSGLTQVNGSALDVSGAFVDVSFDQTAEASAEMPALRAAFAADAPHAQENLTWNVGVLAGLDPWNGFGPGLTGWAIANLRAGNDSLARTLRYGNPFEGVWGELTAIEDYVRVRTVRAPGVERGEPGISVRVGTGTMRPYTPGDPLETRVDLAPPTQLLVNGGTAGDGVRAFDGATPITVSWRAVANAVRYSVELSRVTRVPSNQVGPRVVSVVTTETSVTIPAALFGPNERYLFFVTAIRDTVPFASGTLRVTRAPRFMATTSSGVILLSNDCGNGAPDAAEECDTSGVSATCDVDCSASMCWDGILNEAAGEECDPGRRTPGCDEDCTLVSCGDGLTNDLAGEECDDGNDVGGDGCSAGCAFEHVCPNGAQEPGEACDDGNTVEDDACTNSCREPACGDGIVHAGESCDDGDLIDGDGCNTECEAD